MLPVDLHGLWLPETAVGLLTAVLLLSQVQDARQPGLKLSWQHVGLGAVPPALQALNGNINWFTTACRSCSTELNLLAFETFDTQVVRIDKATIGDVCHSQRLSASNPQLNYPNIALQCWH